MRQVRQGARKRRGAAAAACVCVCCARAATGARRTSARCTPRARALMAAAAVQHGVWRGGALRHGAQRWCGVAAARGGGGRKGAARDAAAALAAAPAAAALLAAAPRWQHVTAPHAHTARRGAAAAVPRAQTHRQCRRTQKEGTHANAAARAAAAPPPPPPPPRAVHCVQPCAAARVRARVCVACAHVVFRLLVRSALTQQRHDGRVALTCGPVQRRHAPLRAQHTQRAARSTAA
jgi:hypothetical protein